MPAHIVRLRSPEHYGARVPPALVAPILQKIAPLAEKSLRMGVLGRSTGGHAPKWLARASDVRFIELSSDGNDTLLVFTAPVLGEVAEEYFKQEAFTFVERLDPKGTALKFAGAMLDDVEQGNEDSTRFDAALLKVVGSFAAPLKEGSALWLEGRGQERARRGHVTVKTRRRAKEWIATAPEPRTVRVTGTLDMVRMSRFGFALLLENKTEVHGVFQGGEIKDYAELLGQRVMVAGRLIYRPSGAPLRLEATHIEPTKDTNPLWATVPKGRPRGFRRSEFLQRPGPGKTLGDFFGSLADPNDDEDAIQKALAEIS